MKRGFIVGILVSAALLLPPRAVQAAGLWDWMQEWSGPGPFKFDGNAGPLFVHVCAPHEFPQRGALRCFFYDHRTFAAVENDNFPVGVKVDMNDVGVTTAAVIGRLHDSVHVGFGIGVMTTTSEFGTSATGAAIGGETFNRMTLTLPRVMLKPGLAVAELIVNTGGGDGTGDLKYWRNVLSVFKVHVGGNLVIGHMQSEDFGVPSSVHQFSEGWEYIRREGCS